MGFRGFLGLRIGAALTVTMLAAGCGSGGSVGTSGRGTGVWSQLPAAPLGARYEAGGVWVNGRFIILGGWSSPICPPSADCAAPEGSALRDGASFDPVAGRWSRIADAPVPVARTNVMTAGNQVYVLTADQGRADSPVVFLSYDPEQDRWATHPLPPAWGTLVAAGSSVLTISGSDEGTGAIDAVFNLKTNKWQRLPDDPLGPSYDRSAIWVNGTLLLAAKDLVANPGAIAPSVVRLARLDGSLSRWTTLPDSRIIGSGPVGVGTHAVWPEPGSADGGAVGNWGESYSEGGILDTTSETWQALPRPPGKPALDCCATVVGQRLLVGGQLLDPATRRWTRIPSLPKPERWSPTVVGSPDTLLVWGGAKSGRRPENLATGYLLRLG